MATAPLLAALGGIARCSTAAASLALHLRSTVGVARQLQHSGMTSLLPASLDERTVPDLVERLDRAFYPTPPSGFTARMAVLEGLTIL